MYTAGAIVRGKDLLLVADVASLCRVTVRAPACTLDLALPADVELVELLPAVVAMAGAGLDEAGLAHGGWVFQRLGDEPLDGERTLQAQGLRDGETLFLRPYRDAMPAVHFDELSDGVATALGDRRDSWQPAFTRGLLLALALVAVAQVAMLLNVPGVPAIRPALLAVVGIALMFAAAVVPGRTAGAVMAAASTGYFTLTVTSLLPDLPDWRTVFALGLTVALCAVIGFAVVGRGAAPLFASECLAGVLITVGGLAMMSGVTLGGAAAIVTLAAAVGSALIPALAARLSGLRAPLVPSNVEQLQEDIDPLPDRNIREGANRADAHLNGMYAATGFVEAVCLTVLAGTAGWWAFTLTATSSLRLLLQGLPLSGRWQRLATMLPGCFGVMLLAARLSNQSGPWGALIVCLGLLGAAVGLVAASHIVPGRRFVPYWGRAADLAHSACAIAAVPLALQVTGLFGFVRAVLA
jgi:type VII secretion integral membrane protein EccD